MMLRLRKEKDFKNIIKNGRTIGNRFLILKFIENNLNAPRIGFVVSQKVSKSAVIRNKIKRKLRAIIRDEIKKIKEGYDLIFFSKKGIEGENFKELKESVNLLFKKAILLK